MTFCFAAFPFGKYRPGSSKLGLVVRLEAGVNLKFIYVGVSLNQRPLLLLLLLLSITNTISIAITIAFAIAIAITGSKMSVPFL